MGVDEYPKEVLDALERDGGIRIKPRGGRSREDDTRFCYGARCTWFGSIHEVGKTPELNGHSLPCCPLCGGVLFELKSEADWWEPIADFTIGNYENGKPHPGYRSMFVWQRENKLCFSDIAALVEAYAAMTGTRVETAR